MIGTFLMNDAMDEIHDNRDVDDEHENSERGRLPDGFVNLEWNQ